MKTYLSLSVKYLKAFSKRTVMTGLAVMLATALIGTIAIMTDSMHEARVESIKDRYGAHHTGFFQLTQAQKNAVTGHMHVDRAGVIKTAGSFGVLEEPVELAPGAWDEQAFLLNRLHIEQGRMPQQPDEIVLPKSAMRQMGLSFEPGMTIELVRIEPHGTSNENRETVITMQVCGVYHSARWVIHTGDQMGLPALVSQTSKVFDAYPASYAVYVTFKQGLDVTESKQALLDALPAIFEQSIRTVDNLMLYSVKGLQQTDIPQNTADRTARLVLISLVITAVVATVYNIYQMASIQRLRQFGLLRCTGTSQVQIAKLVLTEAALTAVIAIPLGMVSAIGLAVFSSTVLSGLFDVPTGLVFRIGSMAGGAALVLLTVLIAAGIPAITASRVSPIQAMKTHASVIGPNTQKHKTWHDALTKLIGPSAKIAVMNVWRHKWKFLISCFSLMLGLTMFITFGYYQTVYQAIEQAQIIPGDYTLQSRRVTRTGDGQTPALSDETKASIESMAEVEGVSGFRTANPSMIVPDHKLSQAVLERYPYILDGQARRGDGPTLGEGEVAVPLTAMSVPDDKMDAFIEFVRQITGVDIELGDQRTVFYSYNPNPLWQSGDMFRLSDFILVDASDSGFGSQAQSDRFMTIEYVDQTYRMEAVIDRLPEFFGLLYTDTIIMSQTDFEQFFGDTGYGRLDVYVTEPNERAVVETVLRGIAEDGDGVQFTSHEDQVAHIRSTQLQMNLLVYGLIGMLTIIAALNIFNTISTASVIRTVEYGMLRAVGLSKLQLYKMIGTEGLSYGMGSACMGLVLGLTLSRILYRVFTTQVAGIELSAQIGWLRIVLAVAAVMILCLAACIRPAKRLADMNMIEAIDVVD